jgi:hypothetical protein
LPIVKFYRILGSLNNVTGTVSLGDGREQSHSRALGIAEPGAFDGNSGIALSRLFSNFGADVLTFSVAIGPNEQDTGIARLLLDVVGYWFAFLCSSALEFDRKSPQRLTGSILTIVSASKSWPGGVVSHFLYRSAKSRLVKWPLTLVMITEQLPHCANLKSNS